MSFKRFGIILSLIFIIITCNAPNLLAQVDKAFAIRINIPARRLDLLYKGQVVREYPIAVGKSTTQTIEGQFKIINRVINPGWYPEGRTPVEPGPDNPVGTRWLGLNAPGYGIHGTSDPTSIGKVVSNGCIRMYNQDVEELHQLVKVGTPVEIVYEPVEVARDPSTLAPIVVRIHPDVYKRGMISTDRLKEALYFAGYTAPIYPDYLTELLVNTDGRARTFPKRYTAEFNGIAFDFNLQIEKGRFKVNALALARLLGTERTRGQVLNYLFEYGWELDPQITANLFGLAVSLDVVDGRLKFSAPYVVSPEGVIPAWVNSDGHVDIFQEQPVTIIIPGKELAYPRVGVRMGNEWYPGTGYAIAGITWVDLRRLSQWDERFAYRWNRDEEELLIRNHRIKTFIFHQGRPLALLTEVRKIVEPELGLSSDSGSW